MNKVCIVSVVGQQTVALTQQGRSNFTVIYGKQVKSRLTYAQAAREYGECIFHALACANNLDNR